MEVADEDILVARAVAEAVQRGGRTVVSEPRRFQGMISDVLGANARTRRTEVDAVVLAASEQVPERLMANSIDAEGATAILTTKGLDAPTADFAVQVWLYALGLLAKESEPPTLTRSVQTTSTRSPELDPPTATPEVFDAKTIGPGTVGHPGTVGFESIVMEAPTPPPNASAPPPNYRAEPFEGVVTPLRPQLEQRPSRLTNRLLVVAVVGTVLIAIVALVALLIGGIDLDSSNSEGAAGKEASISFTDVDTPVGTVSRTWQADGNKLIGHVELENRTDTAVLGNLYEFVPKSMAKSASLITSDPQHEVFKDDPVITWDVSLAPKQKMAVTYTVETGRKIDAKQLATWKTEQVEQEKAFLAEQAAPAEPLKVSISGPENAKKPPDSGCDFELTLNINIPYFSIEWSDSSLEANAVYLATGPEMNYDTGEMLPLGTTTVSARVTAKDGQVETAYHDVKVIPSDDGSC